jgi:hypothetical protein
MRMVVAGMVMIVAGVVVRLFEAFVRPLGCVRLGDVFDCVGRSQRYAFHALCAPNQLPDWGINRLF